MKTSVGIWDALFGERVALEIPLPDGTIRKMQVTVKWFREMQRQGMITPIPGSTVKVNILDPLGGIDPNATKDPSELLLAAIMEPRAHYRVETWIIGKDISLEQYQQFVDPETQELYVNTVYENFKPNRHLCSRALWQQGKQAMDSV
jgi:hypothetical protein